MAELIKKLNKGREPKKRIFKILTCSVVVIFIFYLSFVNITVRETIGRTRNLHAFQEANLEYQELESAYFDLIGGFDLEYIHSLGFVDQRGGDFVTRQAQTAMAR